MRIGGVPEHVSLPWYVAVEEQRIDATWLDQPGGTGAMTAAMADGTLDVIVALTEGVVQAITGGLDARIVQTAIPTALQWGVHVAAAAELTRETDLVGTRAAISRRGSGSHLMAYVLAERLGWVPDDAQHFVEVGTLDGARRALAAGEADYLLWDRFMTQPVVDRGELRRVGVQPTPWPAFVTVARTDVIDERGDDLSAIIAAVAATAAGLTRSDDLIDRLVDRFELAREVAADWWAVTRWGRADDQLTPEQLGEVQRTLLRLGRIDEILPAEQILAAPVA